MTELAPSGLRVFGAVLAGGRSTRMETPKALLPFGPEGDPLVVHTARTLAQVASRVEVASGGRQDVEDAVGERFAVFLDEGTPLGTEPDVGPLGAISAALGRGALLGFDVVLVLGCDMPLVTEEELLPLVAAVAEGADAAFYRVDGRDQPLCAAYGPDCVSRARRALASGARRVVAFLGPVGADGRSAQVSRLDLPQKSASRLMNVNTPRDYDRARARPTP